MTEGSLRDQRRLLRVQLLISLNKRRQIVLCITGLMKSVHKIIPCCRPTCHDCSKRYLRHDSRLKVVATIQETSDLIDMYLFEVCVNQLFLYAHLNLLLANDSLIL